MMDFGRIRAMFMDFGVSPNEIYSMSLGEFDSMVSSLDKMRGDKAPVPTKEEREASMSEFAEFVASDPHVTLS